MSNFILPPKVDKEIQNNRIRVLYKNGYNMDQICRMEKCSKTKVFFAIRGRSKKIVVKDIKKNK